ncbi:MAG: hypothetical protein P8176_15585 [Gammaproteobacteria bacterium]
MADMVGGAGQPLAITFNNTDILSFPRSRVGMQIGPEFAVYYFQQDFESGFLRSMISIGQCLGLALCFAEQVLMITKT